MLDFPGSILGEDVLKDGYARSEDKRVVVPSLVGEGSILATKRLLRGDAVPLFA